MDSKKEMSAIGLLKIFRYGRNLAFPCPKSAAVFPDNPVNVLPMSPSLRCSQELVVILKRKNNGHILLVRLTMMKGDKSIEIV